MVQTWVIDRSLAWAGCCPSPRPANLGRPIDAISIARAATNGKNPSTGGTCRCPSAGCAERVRDHSLASRRRRSRCARVTTTRASAASMPTAVRSTAASVTPRATSRCPTTTRTPTTTSTSRPMGVACPPLTAMCIWSAGSRPTGPESPTAAGSMPAVRAGSRHPATPRCASSRVRHSAPRQTSSGASSTRTGPPGPTSVPSAAMAAEAARTVRRPPPARPRWSHPAATAPWNSDTTVRTPAAACVLAGRQPVRRHLVGDSHARCGGVLDVRAGPGAQSDADADADADTHTHDYGNSNAGCNADTWGNAEPCRPSNPDGVHVDQHDGRVSLRLQWIAFSEPSE